MAKEFKGRVLAAGTWEGEAVVSHQGVNTLATFQKSALAGKHEVTVSDQNNPDLFGKPIAGKALCLPKTIGSTTGGMVLYCACEMNRNPKCMLFSERIDSLACAGSVLASVWSKNPMVVIDELGDEFLDYVRDDMLIRISEDGTVSVE